MEPSSAVSVSTIGTRTDSTQSANPQVIRINGEMQLLSPKALLLLDLAAGSQINSKLNISEGAFQLYFHSSKAQFSPAVGSVVGKGGSLELNFQQGGVWQVPLTTAYQSDGVADSSELQNTATAPLTIAAGGEFVVSGSGTVQGLVSTPLAIGSSQTYVLVKSEEVSSDYQYQGLDKLSTSTDTLGYILSLEQKGSDGTGYLLGTLTHKNNPSLPPSLFYLPHQALPVSNNEQTSVQLLLNQTAIGPFGHQQANWIALNANNEEVVNAWYLQVNPFFNNVKEKNQLLYGFEQAWKESARGVNIQLLRGRPAAYLSAGFAIGSRDSHTQYLPEPVHGHSNSQAAFVNGHLSTPAVELNLQAVYQHGRHHLQQQLITNDQVQVQLDTDLMVLQAKLSHRFPIEGWSITPFVSLSWWYIHQDNYQFMVSEKQLEISDGKQHFWQFIPGIDLASPLLPTVSPTFTWQAAVGAGYATITGEKSVSNQIGLADLSSSKVAVPMPALDKHQWQSHIELRLFGDQLDAGLRYEAIRSSHLLAQEITASITWQW